MTNLRNERQAHQVLVTRVESQRRPANRITLRDKSARHSSLMQSATMAHYAVAGALLALVVSSI